MNETPNAYVTRILGCLGSQDPLQVLAATAGRLRALVAGRPLEDLLRAPDSAHWSTVEILAHMADCEIVSAWRLRSIIASDGVALQPFNQNGWADTFRYRDSDPALSLQLFEINRAATLSLLNRVDPGLHANHGVHQERGIETVVHLISLYAGHDLNHLAQIERLLSDSATAPLLPSRPQ
jgi:hypothetical protein